MKTVHEHLTFFLDQLRSSVEGQIVELCEKVPDSSKRTEALTTLAEILNFIERRQNEF